MKYLIAGLGSIGRRHLRNLLALGERDILLYRTHHSTLPEEELAGFPIYSDLNEAISVDPDAVIIANPTSLHLDIAIPAAQAGCHILLEKPVSHSLERVDELRKAMERSGSRLLVGYQFRYHPGLQKAASLLSENAIGRPLSARAHWGEYLPDWHPWEDYRRGYSARADLGGGVILTLSHPLDYLRWLLGEIVALCAFTSSHSELQIEVEDTAEISLQFKSNILGSVHLDYNQRPPTHYLEVIGDHGSLRWDNNGGDVSLFQLSQEGVGIAEHINIYAPPQGFERNDLFLSEMRHFQSVVRGESAPACTLEDGIQALHLALAAIRSAKQAEIIRLD